MASRMPSRSDKPPDKEPNSTKMSRQKRRKPAQDKGKSREVAQNTTDWDLAEPWSWYPLADDHPSPFAPVFTKDGNYLFSLCRRSVQITSVATGEVVSSLSSSTTNDTDLTCLALNPQNPFQLIVGGLNGHLMIWDFMDAALLRTIDVGRPIHRLAVHPRIKDGVFISVSKSRHNKSSDDAYLVLRVSLTSTPKNASDGAQVSSEVISVGKTRNPTGLAISPSGLWLVATAAHKVYVASIGNLKRGFVKYVSPDRLTCLTVHPQEDYFATGDSRGVVRLWYCLNDQITSHFPVSGVEKKSQTSALHWHAHAVASLCFSSDGAHLFSGGEEAVLVIWQLQFGRKDFLPRVGAPITSISSLSVDDREEVLLSLADGTNLFLNSTSLKVSRSFSRLKLQHSTAYGHSSSSLRFPLAFHSQTSTLLFPSSHPSSLQLFSLASHKIIGELEVSPSNRVSRKDEKPLEPARVDQVVVAPLGTWMVTIDSRQGTASLRVEIHMKLWNWDATISSWTLNTRIDAPHGPDNVLAASFSPKDTQSVQLATCGADGNVRIWRIQCRKSKNDSTEEFWIPRAVLNLRSDVPRHAAWSSDGSLLAVTFSSCVTLYDTRTYTAQITFTAPGLLTPRSAHFLGHHHLATRGAKWIVVWDVVTRSVVWHSETTSTIDRLIIHPKVDSFLAISTSERQTGRTLLSQFNSAASPAVGANSVPFCARNLVCIDADRSSGKFVLAALDSSCSPVMIGDDLSRQEAASPNTLSLYSVPRPRSLFQDIFGQSAFEVLPHATVASTRQLGAIDIPVLSKLFAGPSYLMPPLEGFFEPLVQPLLRDAPDPQVAEHPDSQLDEDEDKSMLDVEPTTAPLLPPSNLSLLPSPTPDELQSFVSLFAQQSISKNSRPISRANGGNTNGNHTHKGATPRPVVPPIPKVNGSPLTRRKSSAAQLLSPPQSPNPPPIGNGKKRKQAP